MALTKEQILTLTCLKEVDVKGVGPQKIFAIGSTIDNLNLDINSYEDLSKLMSGMKEKAIQKVTLSNLNDAYRIAQKIIETSSQMGIGLVGYYDEEYPDVLRKTVNEEGKLDPPLLLWYRGDFSVTQLPGFAVIGTREATPEGVAGGTYLSEELAKRGFNIVSGLAIGCDTCGHKGALKVGGKTTAILATGLDYDSIYPPENQDLAEEIVEKGGLLISEYRIGTPVNRYSLVDRDRLQSGLSLATLVIQTGEQGGTMHAATATLQARKPLYTIYFKDEDTRQHERCLGNALLVRQGAKYIKGSDNLDDISDSVKNWKPNKKDLFDL
ncbi:MAG: DNA-protecting protein DprA [Paludibacteraceae bacterium]|nr:DNA-protecting protein DprA [Paludibacteraceae bacterium]